MQELVLKIMSTFLWYDSLSFPTVDHLLFSQCFVVLGVVKRKRFSLRSFTNFKAIVLWWPWRWRLVCAIGKAPCYLCAWEGKPVFPRLIGGKQNGSDGAHKSSTQALCSLRIGDLDFASSSIVTWPLWRSFHLQRKLIPASTPIMNILSNCRICPSSEFG